MNVIFSTLEDAVDSDEESSSSGEGLKKGESEISPLFKATNNSVDFIKLFRGREGLGLYEPSLPRFPDVGSFLDRVVQDPETKYTAISDLGKFYQIGKHFDEAMVGLTMANAKVSFVESDKILFREEYRSLTNRVKIISGGKGIWSDFVGRGMLTCAVMGTGGAPKSRVIFVAIRQLSKEDNAGTIAIVPKNVEDELNWGIAIAKAQERGMNVTMILVSDGVCLNEGTLEKRGLAEMVLYFKIAGAMSEERRNKKDICNVLHRLSIATISCHINDSFKIYTDYEGLGGMILTKASKEETVKEIIRLLIDPTEKTSLGHEPGSNFVLFINGYSGSWHFLQSIAVEAIKGMKEKNIPLLYVFSGFYVTTPQLGFSVTLMAEDDSNISRWLDGFTTCSGWTYPGTGVISTKMPFSHPPCKNGYTVTDEIASSISSAVKAVFSRAAMSGCVLNKIDPKGQYGKKFTHIAERILKGLELKELDPSRPCDLLLEISEYFLNGFDGPDGIMYALFLTAAAMVFCSTEEDKPGEKRKIDKNTWVQALKMGILEIEAYFMVDLSYGTIVDIFGPVCLLLKAAKYEHSVIKALNMAVEVGFEKYKEIEDGQKRNTPSHRATVYGAYILVSALTEHIRTVLNADIDIDIGKPDSEKRSDFYKRYGHSICLEEEQQDINQFVKKRRRPSRDIDPTLLKRVDEKGDIFCN